MVEHMASFGQATKRDVATFIAETIETMWSAWGTVLTRKEYPQLKHVLLFKNVDFSSIRSWENPLYKEQE